MMKAEDAQGHIINTDFDHRRPGFNMMNRAPGPITSVFEMIS